MDPRNNRASQDDRDTQRDAATRLVRDQLDALYSQESKPKTDNDTRGHEHHSQKAQNPSAAESEHWQQYHNQWQHYYKDYYERYYVGHLNEALENNKKATQTPEEKQEEGIVDLRQKIVDRAKTGAKKARKSRHFVPIISAIVVVGVVAFLQYNQIIIANVQAYVSPGAIDPQNIVVDPNANNRVTSEPRLIIPKINVEVPVIYNVGYDHASQMAAMNKGVAHFAIPGADSVPGQLGNVVLSGHSSNDLFDPGDYKFIFAQLDKLQNGDTILIHYNSIRYTYIVSKKQVVKPNNVGALLGTNDKPVLTLITCTPLGTALNRLLVTADQVAPDPSKAKPINTGDGGGNAVMVGNGPTVLERLFGAR